MAIGGVILVQCSSCVKADSMSLGTVAGRPSPGCKNKVVLSK